MTATAEIETSSHVARSLPATSFSFGGTNIHVTARSPGRSCTQCGHAFVNPEAPLMNFPNGLASKRAMLRGAHAFLPALAISRASRRAERR